MGKRWLAGAALSMLLVCMTLFSGCPAMGLDSKGLMSPPREEGSRGEIQSLLADTVGGEVTFRYPYKGEYRSAINMKDFTGDRKEDAIALYEAADGSGGTTVSFMIQQNGQWKILRSFTNTAVQVDRVCFADLDDDGKREVVIGWGNSTSNSSQACVYDYTQNGVVELVMEQGYGEMAVTNLINDGREELFVATLSSDTKALTQLVWISDGALQIVEAVTLDPTVFQYASVSVGLISQNQMGIMLDGLKADSSMVTQIIYWDDEEETLKVPYSDTASQKMNITSRNAAASYTSRDIDGNSVIEFPVVNLMPGVTEASKDPVSYLVNWNQFDTKSQTPIRIMSTVMNSNDGFWFLFPESWRDKVTCRSDIATHSTTFYEWLEDDGSGNPAAGAAILKIQVFTNSEWKTGSRGYTQIAERGGLIYAAAIPEKNHELAPSISEVKDSFHFLSLE